VQRAGKSVARVLPLSQPEAKDVPKPREGMVKPRIAFGSEERDKSSVNDENETGDSNNMNDQKQVTAGYHPVCYLRQ